MSSTARVVLNLGAILLLTLGLGFYAFLTWVGTDFFDPPYYVTVGMPDAGGLGPDQQVTVRGNQVGAVEEIVLTEDGVDIRLRIFSDRHIPDPAVAQVLRRSPIGEQAIDFIPVAPDWEPPDGDGPEGRLIAARIPVYADWEPAEAGSRIEPVATVLPSSVPAMLDKAQELLSAVDGPSLGTVIDELGTALDGRTDLLRRMNRDAADLGATFVDGIPEFERLIDSSGPVLAVLREHRDALASSFTHAADVSETLASNRPTLDRLVDDGRAALTQADALVRNERANISCVLNDFETLSDRFAEDHQLDRIARLLDLNRFFYGGFDAGTQWDPYRPGIIWARVNILLFEEPGGQPNVPRRPTPPTLPGEACLSPFGLGVNAVRQADPVPPDPTSPGIIYAPLAEEDDGEEARDPDDRPHAAPTPREPLPATGADGGLVLGALGLLAATLAGSRRGSGPRRDPGER
jgi:ABC-type transporter Mla subunit MlaD